jgi:hypothetical protein
MGWGSLWAEEGFPNGYFRRCIESHRLSLRFDFAARMATFQCYSGSFFKPTILVYYLLTHTFKELKDYTRITHTP